MEDVAAGASKQTSSPQYMIRKLVTTWNASTPLRGGAKTRQPLNFNVLLLKHNKQPNQEPNIVKLVWKMLPQVQANKLVLSNT
jgi:hypothetical protein